MHTNTHTKFLSSFTAIQLFHNSASFHPHQLPPKETSLCSEILHKKVNNSQAKFTKLPPDPLFPPALLDKIVISLSQRCRQERKTNQSLNFFFKSHFAILTSSRHFLLDDYDSQRLILFNTKKNAVLQMTKMEWLFIIPCRRMTNTVCFFCFCVFTAAKGSKIALTIKITV